MALQNRSKSHPVLWNCRFLGTSLVGSLLMAAVAVAGTAQAQLSMLGAYVSLVAALFVSYLEQEEHRELRRQQMMELLAVPIRLAIRASFSCRNSPCNSSAE